MKTKSHKGKKQNLVLLHFLFSEIGIVNSLINVKGKSIII